MIQSYEIIVALLSNVKEFLAVVAFASGGLTFVALFVALGPGFDDNEIQKGAYKFARRSGLAFLLSIPIALFPSLQNIWEVRIALIKLQLASPENVQKGTETIERIAKKLECKYLGGECKEEK